MPIEKPAAIAITAAILPVSAQERNRGHCTMQQKIMIKKLTNKTSHENIVDIANFYKWDMKRQQTQTSQEFKKKIISET